MKTNFWKMASALMIGVAMSLASCKNPVEEIIPVFPEQINRTVEPGESYTLTISPNLPWEVSISGDTQFFRMLSGGEPLPAVSGQAGEHELTVEAIVDETDFEQRQCTLTMTMGGRNEVIAVITRNGRDRIFNVYPVVTGDEGFEYGEDGWLYASEPASDFSLYFDGNIFQTYMKVEANFDWALKDFPEWVDAVELEGRYVTSGKANVPAVVCLRGVNEKYPLEGAADKLGFVVNYNPEELTYVEDEITLSIGAVKDIFAVSASESVRFNAAGDYYNAMLGDWQPGMAAKGSAIGIDGVQIFAVARNSYGAYDVVGTSKDYPSISGGWVNISIEAEDDAEVLKTWNYSISVEENTGAARSAEIIVLPGTITVKDPEYDLFTYYGISAEYSDYVFTELNQDAKGGGNDEGGMVSADAAKLAAAGAKLEPLNPMYIDFVDGAFNVGAENCYMLTVSKPVGHYEFNYAKEVWNAEPYDAGLEYDESAYGSWLVDIDDKSFDLDFTATEPYEMKILVLQTGNANFEMVNFAVIVVQYDPYAEIGGDDNYAVSFMYPDYVSGATLTKLSSDSDLYEYIYSETYCREIYELTYTTDNPSMPVLQVGIDYTSIVNWNEDKWLGYDADGSMVLITMDAEEYSQGMLVFQDTSAGYPMPALVIVCTLAV